jgi:hypothetical protein
MQISRTDELDLLTVLHDGMHEQPAWGVFLGRLLRRVGAESVRLLLARGDVGIEMSVRLNRRHVQTRARSMSEADDPTPYGSLRPQRVYDFSEFQTPPGIAGRVVRATEGDLDAWLAIESDDEFSASASSLLSALALHFRIALRNYVAVEHERLQRRVGDWALGRLGRGWMALTATGRVMATDDLAERLLRDGSQLRLSPERRLLAASPPAHQRLARAIEAASADASPRYVRISDEPQLELLIAGLAPEPETGDAIVGASVAVHIQAAPPDAAHPAEALSELFDLSPAIARFAWSLGHDGGIAAAAAELGLTIETARFYSKTLYAKLGVSGQAELARRILTSAAALA